MKFTGFKAWETLEVGGYKARDAVYADVINPRFEQVQILVIGKASFESRFHRAVARGKKLFQCCKARGYHRESGTWVLG